MKICYIILTCEKYINSRAKWLLKYSLCNVEKKDIYFLSCKNQEPNVYGWNTSDTYESCPLKYIRFFQNMMIDYDWYFFMDDDTFILPHRLEKFVKNFDKNKSLYIGHKCDHISFPLYMSGGAGFLMSKPLYLSLINYIKDTDEINYIL